jgi:uncharacterized membrane protein (DUF485 family)
MEKTSNNERHRRLLLKRGYIIIFLIAFIVLICGFVVISIALFAPRPSYGDPNYAGYQTLMKNSSTLAKLLIEIGLSLFSVSSFLGAIFDPNIADTVKRGMMVASGISLLGLVIVFISPAIYVF